MQFTHNQHYVPRTYLKPWENAQGKLEIYDKKGMTTAHKGPKRILKDTDYYEKPGEPVDNALEIKFGTFENAYGPVREAVLFVVKNAVECGGNVSEELASYLSTVPQKANIIKEFAAVSFFRTPAALAAMRTQLNADTTDPLSAMALSALDSPFMMSTQAFDSTLLDRFRNLSIIVMYSHTELLNTCDRPCFPVSGGTGHANFGHDIGRHPLMFAFMPISPRLLVAFIPTLNGRQPFVHGCDVTPEFALQSRDIVERFAERYVVIAQ